MIESIEVNVQLGRWPEQGEFMFQSAISVEARGIRMNSVIVHLFPFPDG